MLGLRLEPLAASLILSSVLLIPCGTVCDALADADKHVPNVETVGPPTEVDSQPATVHPVGSDTKTTPIQSTIAAPDAGDKPGDSTANDKADESSNLGGVVSPATSPTPNADRPLAEPQAASIATPTRSRPKTLNHLELLTLEQWPIGTHKVLPRVTNLVAELLNVVFDPRSAVVLRDNESIFI